MGSIHLENLIVLSEPKCLSSGLKVTYRQSCREISSLKWLDPLISTDVWRCLHEHLSIMINSAKVFK